MGTAEGTIFHFQLVSVTSNSSEKQWVRTKPFQYHTHDVRTVAHSPTALISGGRFCSLPGCSFFLPSFGYFLFTQDFSFCSFLPPTPRHWHPLSHSPSHGEGGGKELRCCSPKNHIPPCKYHFFPPMSLHLPILLSHKTLSTACTSWVNLRDFFVAVFFIHHFSVSETSLLQRHWWGGEGRRFAPSSLVHFLGK